MLDDDSLATVYDGWSASGSPVRIRDAFAPVVDGSFAFRIHLRRAPDTTWRQIGEDHWRHRKSNL